MTMTVLSAYTGRNQKSDGSFYDMVKEDTFLTKTIYGNGLKVHASNLKLYRLEGFYAPESLEELHPLLLKWEKDQHSMLIRYRYKEGTEREGKLVPRNSKLVEQVPSRLVCVDIDDLPMPKGMDKYDIKAHADYAVNVLHKCAPQVIPDDAAYLAQGSSGAGFSDKVKLHLWLENSYELTQGQLKLFFRHINTVYKDIFNTEDNLIDLALYSRTQPHYVAKPRMIGLEDPINPRTVYSYGEPCYITADSDYEFVEVNITEAQRDEYISKIEGSLIPSAYLVDKIEKLRGWDPRKSGARIAVISIYHTAYQECYDFSALDREIRRILKTIRPGKETDYINQGRNAAINNGIRNAARDLPDEVLGIKVQNQKTNEDFYLKLDDLPKNNTVMYLKASLGTGKTTNIVEQLQKYKGSFLTITNNTALVGANAARFGSGVYSKESDRLDLATGKINKMSTTIHSLWRFKDYAFDFIFIDEADATLNDLVSASIIAEDKRIVIRDSLQELFIKSKVVILSDGDISKETMEAYTSLMLGQKDIVKVVHEKENLENGIAYKHKSIESMLGALQGSLEIGEKCLMVTDLSPQKLNEYKKTFERIMPEKVGVVMHAHSKDDDDFQDIVHNTTEALERRKVDYILASPSITNGVDFNYFDTVFVVTTTMSQTPNLRFQALKRERKSNNIHFYLGRLKSYTSGYALLPESEIWQENTRRKLELRKERECANYTNTFIHYLIKAGCRIVVVDDPFTSPVEKVDKDLALEDRALAIYEGKSVRLNNDAADMRKLIEVYIEDPELDDIINFLKNKTYEKSKMLATVVEDFWYVLKHADPEKLLPELSGEKGSLFNRLTGISLPPPHVSRMVKLKMCSDILKRCGLDDPEQAVENYRKYCQYENIPVIPELKEIKEVANELSI